MNEKRSYRELKESVRMLKNQGGYIERDNLIEDEKRMGVNQIIKESKNL